MNNRHFITKNFDFFAKVAENNILLCAYNGDYFNFIISCKYDEYSTDRLKQLHKDIIFLVPYANKYYSWI